jgi:hypothetical protein
MKTASGSLIRRTRASDLPNRRQIRADQPNGSPVLRHEYQAGRHVAGWGPDTRARHRVRRRSTPRTSTQSTYTIQTVSGFYLVVDKEILQPSGGISTRISDPNAAPQIGYAAKFELMMIAE